MSRILELPDELYAAIEEAAHARGLSPVQWIAAQLPQPREEAMQREDAPRSLADLLAGRIGVFGSGGNAHLSEKCGEKFTDYLDSQARIDK